MGDILPIHHIQQSEEGFCLPACARMILGHLGFDQDESRLGRILGAKNYGTPSSAIRNLSDSNVEVIYQEWSVAELLSMLEAGHPLIVFVRSIFLDYCQEDYAHALVVVGAVANQRFWVQDPAQLTGPLDVSWDGLLAAWSEFDYHGAMLRRRQSQ